MERMLRCNQSKRRWNYFVCSVTPEYDQLLLMLSCWWSIDIFIIFLFHHYILTCMNILIRALQRNYLILTYPVWILNPNFVVSFLNFCSIFGIQGKVFVCFLSLYLLSLLLILLAFFTKLLIIFFNVLRSFPFSQNVSLRCSNMLVLVSEGIQECGLICTFVGDG